MKAMRMPGFTANVSLCNARDHYRGSETTALAAAEQVVPQEWSRPPRCPSGYGYSCFIEDGIRVCGCFPRWE